MSMHKDNAQWLTFEIERAVSQITINWKWVRAMSEDLDWDCYHGGLPSKQFDLFDAIKEQDTAKVVEELAKIAAVNGWQKKCCI